MISVIYEECALVYMPKIWTNIRAFRKLFSAQSEVIHETKR